MSFDLCLPLKIRLWTVQLTLPFSPTRVSWEWDGRDGVSNTQPVCLSHPVSFISTIKFSLSIYCVPGTVVNAVIIRQGGWGALCQSPGGGACKAWRMVTCLSPLLCNLHSMQLWSVPRNLQLKYICASLQELRELETVINKPLSISWHFPEPFHQHSGEPAIMGWWDGPTESGAVEGSSIDECKCQNGPLDDLIDFLMLFLLHLFIHPSVHLSINQSIHVPIQLFILSFTHSYF